MAEYSVRDLYKKPDASDGTDQTNSVSVQYTPKTFYFGLNGRFAALNGRLTKRRKRRLLGKLKGHVRAFRCFISGNENG